VLDFRQEGKQSIIINISSFAAYRAFPQTTLYGSSKAAFVQVMSSWANEIEDSKARFVSIHPGAVWTEMTSQHFKKEWFEGWEDAELPGHFALWLATAEASFLNGRFVWAEWDVDELVAAREKIQADPYFLKIDLNT
jgi:NAD(P)-dependent dehydrogenase (short-subunit alcohol dehydrogenase family)